VRLYAGVGAWFLKDYDWASYHWCWVVDNIPDDRLNRRCYIAAAYKGMPYPNPELDGFEAKLFGGRIEVIKEAYEESRKIYLRMKAQGL
jgi:hypothetical protein